MTTYYCLLMSPCSAILHQSYFISIHVITKVFFINHPHSSVSQVMQFIFVLYSLQPFFYYHPSLHPLHCSIRLPFPSVLCSKIIFHSFYASHSYFFPPSFYFLQALVARFFCTYAIYFRFLLFFTVSGTFLLMFLTYASPFCLTASRNLSHHYSFP